MTKMVLEDVEDAQGKPSAVHKKPLLELLGRVTGKVTTNSRIWRCYGKLILSEDNLTETNMERVSTAKAPCFMNFLLQTCLWWANFKHFMYVLS